MAGNSKIQELNIGRWCVLGIVALLLLVGSRTFSVSAAGTDSSSTMTGKVYVQVDGKKTPVIMTGTETVEEVLRRYGLTLGDLDVVKPDLTHTVSVGDVISVTRREYVTQVEKGVIPYDTVYYYSKDTTPGKETVVVPGEEGYGERTYKRLLENGTVVEETLLEEHLGKEPVTREIAIGFRTKPISDFDFHWEFDENGEPLDVVNVLRGQRSTAYTARAGAGTASGRPAQLGHVAVNPNVIPYGSKLFIQSPDGSIIYGYAIAADTGTALMDGRSGIDLFYNTMEECIQHGVKTVDVFVLE